MASGCRPASSASSRSQHEEPCACHDRGSDAGRLCRTDALPTTNQAELKGPRPGMVPGYLKPPEVLDAIAVVAPPPKPGSAAQAADGRAYRAAVAARTLARWRQAVLDAEERNIHKALQNFSCALGVDITRSLAPPHLLMLARRSMTDIGVAYDKGKDHYSRTRPYHGPQRTELHTGLYEHRARGPALLPLRACSRRLGAVAGAGRDGAGSGHPSWRAVAASSSSRVACGVHWQSDVDAGRDVGAAVVAQLHGNEEFLTQLAQALGSRHGPAPPAQGPRRTARPKPRHSMRSERTSCVLSRMNACSRSHRCTCPC